LPTATGVVVVSTHDDRLIPLADQVIELVPHFNEGDAVQDIELADGEILFRQGSRGHLVYVIQEGKIDIIRELSGGGEDHLATLQDYEYFGELGAFLTCQRNATARANGTAVLKGYPVPLFTELAGGAPLTEILRREAVINLA